MKTALHSLKLLTLKVHGPYLREGLYSGGFLRLRLRRKQPKNV